MRPDGGVVFRIRRPERAYVIGWLIVAGIFAASVVLHRVPVTLSRRSHCMMQIVTGLYCPGCGGTRAVLALLLGHIRLSFYFHPLIVYIAAIFAAYMLTHTAEYLSRGRLRISLHFHILFVYIAIGLVLVNWIVRNILLLCYHIPLG